MHDIEMHEASRDFAECWRAAGIHLNSQASDGIRAWLRAHLSPPFLEHLSFRLGNQLFFIRIEDADGTLQVPGNRTGLLTVADGCAGHPCLMPMKKRLVNGWAPARAGWGLVHARTGAEVDPVSLITDENIEMTAWELQDFGVQVVRDQLEKDGFKLMSWQSNPSVDPAIWFVGKSDGPEWIVVRTVRYPETQADRPGNWDDIVKSCAKLSSIGHFASVAFAPADESLDPIADESAPLWRGHGVIVSYQGLTD